MKNQITLRLSPAPKPSLPETRLAFRKHVEAQVAELPQRLFGVKRNSFQLRLSTRFIQLLLRLGLHAKSNVQEIRTTLEQQLFSPLSRIVSSGQLTFGDVLVIRTNKQNNEIEIERVNRRRPKEEAEPQPELT